MGVRLAGEIPWRDPIDILWRRRPQEERGHFPLEELWLALSLSVGVVVVVVGDPDIRATPSLVFRCRYRRCFVITRSKFTFFVGKNCVLFGLDTDGPPLPPWDPWGPAEEPGAPAT